MDQAQMKSRTKAFAIRVAKVADALPRASRAADVIGRQLLRAGTSVGANYRAACRARSHAEFVSKLGIVEEEADECGYWLEVLAESELIPPARLTDLRRECNELTAIVVASLRTARRRNPLSKPGRLKPLSA